MATRTFELGLVMAGAVSAGAYTAGVLDFLFEALDAWEQERAAGRTDIPDHRVVLRVASGSSAGGVVAALAALLPLTEHRPIRDLALEGAQPAEAEHNLLYRSWVRDIDIVELLDPSDLGPGPFRSLLNGKAVRRVAEAAIGSVQASLAARGARPRPFLANPLQLYLTLTNMTGVPYVLRMTGDGAVRGHRVVNHADVASFAVFGAGSGPAEAAPRGAVIVNGPGAPEDAFARLSSAALATAAFPLGLPARRVRNPREAYEAPTWARGTKGVEASMDLAMLPDHAFASLDGGVLDNEPIVFARRALFGDGAGPAEAPTDIGRILVMIDPFPDDVQGAAIPPILDAQVDDVLRGVLPLLIRQARFHPEEVVHALGASDLGRFLIAPRRGDKRVDPADRDPRIVETDIASAGLGGFAGFLWEAFRRHDFQLGRRNCQRFLATRFVAHKDNPRVAPWVRRLSASQLDAFRPDEPPVPGARREDFVRMIPLLGTSARTVEPLPWPRRSWAAHEKHLRPRLEARAGPLVDALFALADRMLDLPPTSGFKSLLKSQGIRALRRRLPERALSAIRGDLESRGLLG